MLLSFFPRLWYLAFPARTQKTTCCNPAAARPMPCDLRNFMKVVHHECIQWSI